MARYGFVCVSLPLTDFIGSTLRSIDSLHLVCACLQVLKSFLLYFVLGEAVGVTRRRNTRGFLGAAGLLRVLGLVGALLMLDASWAAVDTCRQHLGGLRVMCRVLWAFCALACTI